MLRLENRCWLTSHPTLGGEHWITRSTSGMSNPRAATLVATRTSKAPFLKPFSVVSLCFCGISPWRDWALWKHTNKIKWDMYPRGTILLKKCNNSPFWQHSQTDSHSVMWCNKMSTSYTCVKACLSVRLPVWGMNSRKAHWHLSWSHRTLWFFHGCHCKPGSHLQAQLYAVTSDKLWPDATKETEKDKQQRDRDREREAREWEQKHFHYSSLQTLTFTSLPFNWCWQW